MNKPKRLPSLADVEKVNKLLNKDLEAESDPILATTVLASVNVFNREVQRMKYQDYQKGTKSEMNQPEQEILYDLTTPEKKLACVLHRVKSRGNLDWPVLLTGTMVDSIDKLCAISEHSALF